MNNKTGIANEINSELINNTSGLITPAVLRGVLLDMNDSTANLLSNADILGLNNWNSTFQYSSGGGVFYGDNIYKAVAQLTTLGTFVPSEWVQTSQFFSDATSGLAAFLLRDNGIELDNSKFVKTLTTDSSISGVVTGIYKCENQSSPVGLSEQYPIAGKGTLLMFRRASQSESLMLYYPHNSFSSYFIKKVNGNWTEFKSGITYTSSNGITQSGNDFQLGGNFNVVTLTGNNPAATVTIQNTNNVNINSNYLNISGTTSLNNTVEINDDLFLNSAAFAGINNNVAIVGKNILTNKVFLYSLDSVKNGTSHFVVPANNGITLSSGTYGLGGTITKNTDINVSNHSFRIKNGNNVIADLSNFDLYDSNQILSMDFSGRSLFASSSGAIKSIDYNNFLLKYGSSPNKIALDWNKKIVYDNSTIKSIDWQARQLIHASAGVALDWSNSNQILAKKNFVVDYNVLLKGQSRTTPSFGNLKYNNIINLSEDAYTAGLTVSSTNASNNNIYSRFVLGSSYNLQSVNTLGNSQLYLSPTSFYHSQNTFGSANIGFQGGTNGYSITTSDGNPNPYAERYSFFYFEPNSFKFSTRAGYAGLYGYKFAHIKTDKLIQHDRTYQMPDASGTFALTKDYSTAGNGLTQVGNNINLGGVLSQPNTTITDNGNGATFTIQSSLINLDAQYFGMGLGTLSMSAGHINIGSITNTTFDVASALTLNSYNTYLNTTNVINVVGGSDISVNGAGNLYLATANYQLSSHFHASSAQVRIIGAADMKLKAGAGMELFSDNSAMSFNSGSNISVSSQNGIYTTSGGSGITFETSSPMRFTANSPIFMKVNSAPLFLETKVAPIYLTSPNAPVLVSSQYNLRYADDSGYDDMYSNNDHKIIPSKGWVVDYVGTSGVCLPLSGGTMTGDISFGTGTFLKNAVNPANYLQLAASGIDLSGNADITISSTQNVNLSSSVNVVSSVQSGSVFVQDNVGTDVLFGSSIGKFGVVFDSVSADYTQISQGTNAISISTSNIGSGVGKTIYLNPSSISFTGNGEEDLVTFDEGGATFFNDFLTLPKGGTSFRPSSPVSGMVRYNTDTNKAECYDGTTWQDLW